MDAGCVNWTLGEENRHDPRRAIDDLLKCVATEALDPRISESAAKLVEAQRWRDAQVCDDRAKHHVEMCQKALDKGCGIKARERLVQKIEAQACAATIWAARTPQEPT